MDEEQELQSRIHALQGRITTATSYGPGPRSHNTHYRAAPYYVPRGRGRGRGRGYPTSARGSQSLAGSRGTGSLNDKLPTTQTPINHSNDISSTVSKSDQLRQLTRTPIHITQSLGEATTLSEIGEPHQRDHDDNERRQLDNHLDATSAKSHPATPTVKPYELKINDIPFQVTDGGKKLVCMSRDPKTRQSVPQKYEVAGVVFYKSKSGNLYRAGTANSHMSRDGQIKKSASLCPNFTATGYCKQGSNCPFAPHDANKVALCKDFLKKGICPVGNACDLSHEPTPHRTPACVHFQRGNCTNDPCRYPHVKVNPNAPVCREFARLGYCDRGANCPKRHVFECPDYANTGTCHKQNCRLQHIDRAAQLRKISAGSPNNADDRNFSDLSSEFSESDGAGIDPPVLNEEVIGIQVGNEEHDFSRQHDFIPL